MPPELSNCAANTDREIWRQTPGDYYSPSIHVTERGGIGINCGGTMIVKTAKEWHALETLLLCTTESLKTARSNKTSDSRLETVFREGFESICDAIESFANRMCEPAEPANDWENNGDR